MKKYYRVQANIDLDAIYYNIKNVRDRINKDTKIMAILKADGYGHGAVAAAKVIDELVEMNENKVEEDNENENKEKVESEN